MVSYYIAGQNPFCPRFCFSRRVVVLYGKEPGANRRVDKIVVGPTKTPENEGCLCTIETFDWSFSPPISAWLIVNCMVWMDFTSMRNT